MSTLKTWDEMSPEQQERIRNFARESFRFQYKKIDQSLRDYVVDQIDHNDLEPFHSGQSINGIWDSCFEVDDKCYQLLGSIYEESFTVTEIIDTMPEKGSIVETYNP